MSKYGFDLDGTLEIPAIRQLANDLFDAGHEVYVLTGWIENGTEITRAAELKARKLAELGVRYTGLSLCRSGQNCLYGVAKAKAQIAKDLGVIMLIDDIPDYCQAAGEEGIATLLVYSGTRAY